VKSDLRQRRPRPDQGEERPGVAIVRAVGVAAALALLETASFATVQERQARLSVFISVDMEGVGGVVSPTQVAASGHDYAFGRRMMTAETNAAIAGALAAGATRVTVVDSHGSGTNLLARDVDRRAALVSGFPMPGGMVQGIGSDYDAVVFVGYHAHARTDNAIMGHTYTSGLRRVMVNGREVGEFGLNAALAGHYGVPVVFISGDRAAVEEARALCPEIEVLAVKEALSRSSARLVHPGDIPPRISDGVRRALERRSAIPPLRLNAPITIEVELDTTLQADNAALVPGVERVNGTTVRYRSDSMVEAYRFLHAARPADGMKARAPLRPASAAIALGATLASSGAALASQARPGPKLKVFVSVDMEGVAGVVAERQVGREGSDYSVHREQMMAEANAAVAGAFDAGATEVVVLDSHGGGTNLHPDQLDRRATLISGTPRPWGMVAGLDATFDAMVFVGYHAGASVSEGVLAHTFNRSPRSVRLNGQVVGEGGLSAAVGATSTCRSCSPPATAPSSENSSSSGRASKSSRRRQAWPTPPPPSATLLTSWRAYARACGRA
jgi:D-amino peptidase